jgi:hypothetical protein
MRRPEMTPPFQSLSRSSSPIWITLRSGTRYLRRRQLNQKGPPLGRSRGLRDWGRSVLFEGKYRAFIVRTLGLCGSKYS